MGAKGDAVLRALKAHFLAYPGAQLRSPWPEHDALAIGDKIFVFLPTEGCPLSVTVKLPYTGEVALDLPYAAPTGYGLGRSGWVTFRPDEDEIPPLDQLKDWIDESYRARAPRKLVKELDFTLGRMTSATISNERSRAWWSKICDVIISSSAPVRATKASIAARTVAGEPIAEQERTWSSIARACGSKASA